VKCGVVGAGARTALHKTNDLLKINDRNGILPPAFDTALIFYYTLEVNMKRINFFTVTFVSIMFLALIPVRAFALNTEAVFGEPFGVCRIELPMSSTEQKFDTSRYYNYDAALFEIVHQASIHESNKRVLYPTWSTRIDSKSLSRKKTLLFLFQGQDELDVLISRTGIDKFQEKVVVKPVENEELHKELIEKWWDAYCQKIQIIRYLDFYDPTVELGIAGMMSRRLNLPSEKSRIWFSYFDNDFGSVFGFLLGIESIRLAMQTDTMLEAKDKSEVADKDLPKAVSPPVMPIPHFDESEVKVEPLAMRVPEECFYLRFGSFSAFLETRDFLDRWGTIIRSIVSSRGADYGVSKRIERQLALRETALSRYFGSSVIDDVAIIGADTFLREGAAIGVLFQAKQSATLKNQLDSIRSDIMKEDPSVRESSEIINGHTVSLLSSPGNEVRSFYVEDGDYHLVTTSKWILQAFLATAEASDRSLGGLKEFRYARSQINSSEKGIFIYLSDPFFRNLVGPAYRVEMARRAQSISELQMMSLARLAAIREGIASPSIVSLIESGFLPKGFGMRYDNSQPVFNEDGAATDSIRGAIGTFLPVPDVAIDKITSAEAESYEHFAVAYNRMWTNMDPVFGLLVNERNATGEQLELKLNISPYAKSRYGDLDRYLGAPAHDRIATVSGDLVFLEAQLAKDLSRELIQLGDGLRIFCGLRDTNIPWTIDHGATDLGFERLSRIVERILQYYIGITVPPNFDVNRLRFLFRNASKPDAEGYAKLDDNMEIWSRRFGSYYIVGSGRPLLEYVTPNIQLESADYPSQISLNLGDLRETSFGNLLRAEAYIRDRRTSAGNALLLHAYQQQLQPHDLNGALKAIQNQSLVCPLGGSYIPVSTDDQPDRWSSTAWTEATLYETNQLPDTYRQAIIEEMKNLRLEFSIDPDTLKSRLQIQTKKTQN
jgi:hypothetical protein